jgi:hypothetical protein
MIGSCLVSLPLESTQLFGSYGFDLSSPAIFGFKGVVPLEISRNSSPQPSASFLTPPANDPALRLNSLSQLISLTVFFSWFPPSLNYTRTATLSLLSSISSLSFGIHFSFLPSLVHAAGSHNTSPASAFTWYPSCFSSPVHDHGLDVMGFMIVFFRRRRIRSFFFGWFGVSFFRVQRIKESKRVTRVVFR